MAGELWIPWQTLISIPKQWGFPHGWIVTEEVIEPGLIGSGVMTRVEFARMMAEGLNEAFEDFYASYDPKWAAVRVETNQALGKLRMTGITKEEMYRA